MMVFKIDRKKKEKKVKKGEIYMVKVEEIGGKSWILRRNFHKKSLFERVEMQMRKDGQMWPPISSTNNQQPRVEHGTINEIAPPPYRRDEQPRNNSSFHNRRKISDSQFDEFTRF
ncbi:MAG: hypothetical protein HYZ42_03215 [Bacteroidetes bacterium]|nr:hypothetical protein [Bacteroidota bacterium]